MTVEYRCPETEDIRLLGIPLTSGFRRIACRALRSGRLWVYAAALAVLLALPALWVGWQADDHMHRLYFAGLGEIETPMSGTNLFDFLKGDPGTTGLLMDMGVLPWWTLPELRISFWRPVTSLTQRADYTFWPESAPLMHAHSLAWFALTVALAAFLYRRLMGATWVAGAAALLFAVDDAHAVPAGWLANRKLRRRSSSSMRPFRSSPCTSRRCEPLRALNGHDGCASWRRG